jgi:hypothetical protein
MEKRKPDKSGFRVTCYCYRDNPSQQQRKLHNETGLRQTYRGALHYLVKTKQELRHLILQRQRQRESYLVTLHQRATLQPPLATGLPNGVMGKASNPKTTIKQKHSTAISA